MATIPPVNIASATASNWLKEAQESLLSAANPGGLMGALQNARHANGSIKSFLANSQRTAANLAFVSMNSVEAAGELAAQMASAAIEKRIAERLAAAQNLSKPQKNYTPPRGLDPVIYFANGSTLDTTRNILTLSDGKQIDATTGRDYVDESAVIRMANGAYLDTKNNILVLADGTKIDTITRLIITA
jgi:hypothetical protein